ncbi:YciI family protein [Luteipulveratus mongoliensis]|uniref:YCII-related domain-containing protein n=1 Tax=Luteipulveratus mongoliensis TaxID=571913 RepID=A0A0K1JFR8_9MICO|nr:YciI family protein [Luteipulveratus mongoliensis]AKU15546.1 hypothetical protein VV02_06200 [Luteipulveratus mongoliensis]
MRYVVLIAYKPWDWEHADEATQQEYFEAHRAFEKYVEERGGRIDGAALAGTDLATTVRHGDDGPVVTDGPFVELTEQIGGYYDVELPDLDAAIEAAKLLPRSYTLEIRPTVKIEGYSDA